MFFASSQLIYLEVTFLKSNIVSLNPKDETILSIESELVTRIVTCRAVEDCSTEKAVDMLVRDNVLATDKTGDYLLGLRQAYRWMQGASAATLMREVRFFVDDTRSERSFKRAGDITNIPAITILSIVNHDSRKRRRE